MLQEVCAPPQRRPDLAKILFCDLFPYVLRALCTLCDPENDYSLDDRLESARKAHKSDAWRDGRALRALCSGARAAFDSQRTDLRLTDKKGGTAEQAVRAAAGFVARGCRPRTVVVDLRRGDLAERQERMWVGSHDPCSVH
jgi:hypothetical protein